MVYDGRGADGLGVQNSPAAFSGARGVYSVSNVDGISGNTRSGASLDTPVNMDSVAEVKVLLNNYQAEYGKGAAGVINVITKGGTQNFHGLGYYYMRNEALNANNFFNNAAGAPRGPYRYKTMGGNLGGPLYIPKHFNRNKNKLFFFFAQEFLPRTVAQDPRYYTVPTAAERKGDFNQSVGATNGSLYSAAKIVDPLTKNSAGVMQPFPGGIVPANRIDPNMQKLLSVFPLPNAPNLINGGALNPSGTWYNYSLQDSLDRPGKQNSLRVDYNITDKWRAFFRGTNESTDNKGANSTVNRYAWMADADVNYRLTGPNLGGTVTWVATPTLINEVVFGYGLWTENQVYRDAWLAEVQRDKLGINLPQIYPDQNPLKLIPSVTFGSTNIGPNATTTAWEGRFPMADEADTWTFTDNLTKVWRNHQFKGGLQYEKVHYLFEQSGPNDVFAGKFDFSFNSANTVNNTTYPYANALLGYFNSYTESTNRTQYSPVTPILEFYVQDTWKVVPRLTIDIGVRFTAGLQQYQSNNLSSSFVPSLYNPAKAPLLYRPVLVGSTRMAYDPRNPGVILPGALIGQIIPGTGDKKNGIVQAGDPGYPRALVDYQGILRGAAVWLLLGCLRRFDDGGARRVRHQLQSAQRVGDHGRSAVQSADRLSAPDPLRKHHQLPRQRRERHVHTAVVLRFAQPQQRPGAHLQRDPRSAAAPALRHGPRRRLCRDLRAPHRREVEPQQSSIRHAFPGGQLRSVAESAAVSGGRLPAALPGILVDSVPQLRRQFQLPLAAGIGATAPGSADSSTAWSTPGPKPWPTPTATRAA